MGGVCDAGCVFGRDTRRASREPKNYTLHIKTSFFTPAPHRRRTARRHRT
jgi:hypothetical protein